MNLNYNFLNKRQVSLFKINRIVRNNSSGVFYAFLILGLLFSSLTVNAQCITNSAFGTLNVPTNGNTVSQGSVWAGERPDVIINAGGVPSNYIFTSSVATDFLTFTDASNNVIGFGVQPLTVNITATGTYRLHVHTNAACGTQNVVRTLSGKRDVPPPTLNCGTATVLTAGTPVTSGNLAVAGGIYSVTSCGFSTPGNERLYSFTTTVAGVYSLDVTGVNGGSGYIDYFFKDASGGCGPTGWTCIDDINAVGSATITLAASTTYFILLDAESTSGTANHTFQVTAPAGPVTCGGTFYDNGGAGGNYSNNLNTTTTIFPVNVGDGVIATFTAFGTESCCDSLSIYDGPDATYPLIGTYAGTTSPGVVTSTDSASGALTFVFTSDTSLVDIGWAANITCFTFPTDTPDYVNLQFPATATILAGNSATVYAQVYEAGLTDTEPGLSGQAAGIEAWIGISPIGSNSNPNTWTTWIPATHNAGHVSNNDEYQASIGSALVPGTYYYASRFRLNGGPFVYGGNPFNAWDGTTSVSGVLTVNPNPTQCATNVAPVDAATNVTIGTVALSWAAPTSGPAPTSYDVYYGTTSGALTLVTNTTSLTYNASAPAYSTPYYWRIVPKSTVGGDATACSEWSFTTQPNPFAPYCSTITYSIDVEPITSVDFAGITNTSSNTVDGSPALENFISISGNVTTENSYTLTLKGNTAGNFTTNFRVFIDWNQDGDFADLGETFNAGSVTNSNGLDATSAVSTIAVPSSALAGSTRMRIKKLYSVDSGSVDNPCEGGEYGQTEDYTLNVTLCTPLNWYADNDGDTYGDPTTLVSACTSPGANYVLVSGDCNDANPAVNPNATEVCYDGIDNNCDGTIDEGCTPIISVVQTAQCGSTLSSINQQIFANLVAGAQGYRFRVTDMSNMQVQTIDRNLRVFQLTQLTNYAFDRTYQIEVSIRYNNVWQPFYGAPCTVTTPATTTQVQAAQCGGTLTTIGDAIYANNVPFATGYKFRITNLLTSAQEEVERPLRDIKMTQTSIAEFNSTYSVEVAVRNTNGLYLPYGTPCNITTPSFPTTQLQLAQCDVILTNPNTVIYADSYAGATTYRFRFTNTGLGYTYQFDRSLRTFELNTVPGLVSGETYSVQVSIEIGGVFGPFGKVCTLTTPGSARATETTKPALSFNAIVSPNPFGESFGLEVSTSTEATIQVKVYDMLGKLVESREVDSTTISELQIGATYPSGVYNVIVSQGEEVKTLRVIKR